MPQWMPISVIMNIWMCTAESLGYDAVNGQSSVYVHVDVTSWTYDLVPTPLSCLLIDASCSSF